MVVSKFWKLGGGRCVPSEGAKSGHAVQGSAGTSELSKPVGASTAVRAARSRRVAEKRCVKTAGVAGRRLRAPGSVAFAGVRVSFTAPTSEGRHYRRVGPKAPVIAAGGLMLASVRLENDCRSLPARGPQMDETIEPMSLNEVIKIAESKPQKGEFYTLSPDMRGSRGHGVVFENDKNFPLPANLRLEQSGSGIKEFKDVPRLRQSHPDQMVNDLDSSFRGYWLVSETLKNVFESLDPEAFSFAKCEFTLYDGSQAAPHYFCEVIREVDALDEDASVVKILTEGYPRGKHYNLAGGASLIFKKDLLREAHVFRTPYNSGLVICDRFFRDALIKHGFGKGRNSRGVWLRDAADY